MIVQPKVRGFICTTAHPDGCYCNVEDQVKFIRNKSKISDGPKKVLIIGSSTGYGLATRIVASFGCGAKTIGVSLEREAKGNKTASAGWYNNFAFLKESKKVGLYAKNINGDAFSNSIKQQTIELIKKHFKGGVDLIIYSMASGRRLDPITNLTHTSALKPIGNSFTNKTVDVMRGEVSNIVIDPATDKEIMDTIKVMGGEDWRQWISALGEEEVLAPGCKTVAYSYVGPKITFPIYRDGTIGKAKIDLERTAKYLDQWLANCCGGSASISVNKAVVTQASAAIPVVPLYVSILYKVMKEKEIHEGCIEQIWRLFNDYLYHNESTTMDFSHRIRLDDLELQNDVQDDVVKIWDRVNSENIEEITDLKGYRDEFFKLFGFNFESIDYDKDVEVCL